VVLQDPAVAVDSVLVVPVTSVFADAATIRVYLAPGADTGLRAPSWAMADKLTAVRRSRVSARIGQASGQALREIEEAVLVVTGIAAR
jgi:mRNA-degrading endonuclease toxin of MazEF toxin-antitoxin module